MRNSAVLCVGAADFSSMRDGVGDDERGLFLLCDAFSNNEPSRTACDYVLPFACVELPFSYLSFSFVD